MPTRSQTNFTTAERLVGEVATKPKEVQDIYGGLCHSFPVMVRTCGLCQAVAFSLDKAGKDGDRATAHRLILEHVGQLLPGQPRSKEDVVTAIRTASTTDYMLYTRLVLESWIFFKRFAVSILKVQSAEAAKDDSSPTA